MQVPDFGSSINPVKNTEYCYTMQNCSISSTSGKNGTFPFTILGFQNCDILENVCLNTVAIIVLNALCSPVIIGTNALVIWSVVKTQTSRRSNYKILLAFLASTDLLVGGVAQPLYIASRACHLKVECDSSVLDILYAFFITMFIGASFFHLVIISGERYLAIQYALRYATLVTFKKLLCGVTLSWILALMTALTQLQQATVDRPSIFRPLIVLIGALSAIILLYCNIRLLFESRKHYNAIKAQTPRSPEQQTNQVTVDHNAVRSGQFKAMKTTALIIGGIFIFFVPKFTVSISLAVTKTDIPNSTANIATDWSNCFIILNSLFNPLIYCWRIKDMRQICLETVQKLFCERVHNEIIPLPQ